QASTDHHALALLDRTSATGPAEPSPKERPTAKSFWRAWPTMPAVDEPELALFVAPGGVGASKRRAAASAPSTASAPNSAPLAGEPNLALFVRPGGGSEP